MHRNLPVKTQNQELLAGHKLKAKQIGESIPNKKEGTGRTTQFPAENENQDCRQSFQEEATTKSKLFYEQTSPK